MDDAGIEALREAIHHLHGLQSEWIESVPVKETHEGSTVWDGEVQVFAVEHPMESRPTTRRGELDRFFETCR